MVASEPNNTKRTILSIAQSISVSGTIVGVPIEKVLDRFAACSYQATTRIHEHRQTVTGLYVGGIIMAGLRAPLPGRVLWPMFFD